MRTLAFLFVVVLAYIHGSQGELCTKKNYWDDDFTYISCTSGCCGEDTNQHCCSSYSINTSGWSATYTGLSTAVIIGIVVGCVIFIASIVGIILCCVCCARAASSPSTRGVVLSSPSPPMAVIAHGSTNTAYAPPQQMGYPMSPYGNTTTEVKY